MYYSVQEVWNSTLTELAVKYAAQDPGIERYTGSKAHLEGLYRRYSVNPIRESNEWVNQWVNHAYRMNSLVKGVDVPIYNISNGKIIGSRTIYGPATLFNSPRLYRLRINRPKNQDELVAKIDKAIIQVQRKNPAFKACPSHDSWMTEKGDIVCIDIMFATNGYSDVSENYSRYQLWYHLNERSRYLGKIKAVVVEDGSIKEDDGVVYVKEGSIGLLPWNVLKCIGYSNFDSFLEVQGFIAKGMVKELSLGEFRLLKDEYGVNGDYDAIIPAITPKFFNGESTVELDMYSVFDTIISDYVSIPWQGAARIPLTEKGEKLIEATWKERIVEIMEASKDLTGQKMLSILNSVYQELTEEDLDDERKTEIYEYLESLSASIIETMFCPTRADEFLNDVLGIVLKKRLKKIRIPGFTGVAMPDSKLKYHEVILPRRMKKKYKLKIGDVVTGIRSPATGIEWADCVIVGFSDDPCVYINPRFWAERFSGDFDGDLIGIILVGGIVNEAAIAGQVSSKTKGKRALTIGEAIAKSMYSKLAIGLVDILLYIAIENGVDPTPIREALQAIIDNIKHDVDLKSMDELMALAGIEDGTLPPIYKLIRGKIGEVTRANTVLYNLLVEEMQTHRSSKKWIRNLEDQFLYLVSKNKFLKSDGAKRILTVEEHKSYVKLLKSIGYDEYAKCDGYSTVKLNRSHIRRNEKLCKQWITKLSTPANIKLAEHIHTAYNEIINKIRESHNVPLLNGELLKEAAFERLRSMNKYLRSNPEAGGDAIKLLFLAITYRRGLFVNHEDGADKVLIKNYKIFSYLPIEIGRWNLKRSVDFFGGKPAMDYKVVSPGAATPRPTNPGPNPGKDKVINLNPNLDYTAVSHPERDMSRSISILKSIPKNRVIVTGSQIFVKYLKENGYKYLDISGKKVGNKHLIKIHS